MILPNLSRLLTRLQLRTFLGVSGQALCLGAGVGVLAWGLSAGLLRWDYAPQLAVLPALFTAAYWLHRKATIAAPLPVLARAEQELRLHELWTTAWTLEPVTSAATPTAPAPSPVAEHLAAQIRLRAEAAAQTASAAQLLPLRLPGQWTLALVLAFIGVAVGLRPQSDEAVWNNAGPVALGTTADPSGGGGGAAKPAPAIDPAARPDNPATHLQKLTPAEIAAHQASLDALIKKIDTPEKLHAAQQKLAELQRQAVLPADRLRAFEAQLLAREKALAQNNPAGHPGGETPGAGTTDPILPPGGDPAFQPVALLNPDGTLNPAVLQEAELQYPEYTGALTRYVQWLAEHGKP